MVKHKRDRSDWSVDDWVRGIPDDIARRNLREMLLGFAVGGVGIAALIMFLLYVFGLLFGWK
mgnify:CR=1 FL=1